MGVSQTRGQRALQHLAGEPTRQLVISCDALLQAPGEPFEQGWEVMGRGLCGKGLLVVDFP
jgi:hypothetical protein